MMKRLLTVFLLLGLATGCAYAQTTREELQKKEQDLKKELADLNRQQLEIQKNKKLSLSQLAIIKRKVKAREELVNSISKQIPLQNAASTIAPISGSLLPFDCSTTGFSADQPR